MTKDVVYNVVRYHQIQAAEKIGWRYAGPYQKRRIGGQNKQSPTKNPHPNKLVIVTFDFQTKLQGKKLSKRRQEIFDELERVAPLP